MTAREIGFTCTAWEVRAFLDGRKTQARRVVKGAPDDWSPIGPEWFHPIVVDRNGDEQPGSPVYGAGNDDGTYWFQCPFGKPGDRLWVRECFAAWWNTKTCKRARVMGYKADIDDADWNGFGHDDPWWLSAKWESSMCMPRWASRITLEVVDLRAERLQSISSDDCFAEGIDPEGVEYQEGEHLQSAGSTVSPERYALARLWDSTNAKRAPFSSNPWVWVPTLRRIA